jgi:hypothetical protein
VTLKDGRALTRHVDSFKGTPEQPLDRAEMRDNFLLLTKACAPKAMARLFDRLQTSKANAISTGSRSTRRKRRPPNRPQAAGQNRRTNGSNERHHPHPPGPC